MSTVITKNFVFVEETCIFCGISFFMPEAFQQERTRDHKNFYCPNGHGQIYASETEAERLRKELNAAMQREETIRQQREEARGLLVKEQEKLRLANAAAKRQKKRQAAGVCPCCHRTVSAMARHMKTKHPDFAP